MHTEFNPPKHHSIGEKHGRAKLNEEKVREIRIKAAAGAFLTDLAKEYGVSNGTIGYVVNRFTWQHVD